MRGALVVGTVRARQGARHTIVTADGSRRDVTLEGDEIPRIGGDVIGIVDGDGGDARMRLVKDIAKVLLQGRTLISVSGRPEVTARMLSRLLQGSGPAIVAPGIGGIIERTPHVHDPDLSWALSALEPEARRLGIALNVIDPMALAKASWGDASLKDDLLPADATGDGHGLRDVKRLMRAGFSPACMRAMEKGARGAGVSSVDFVMPYSPFATGYSFSNDVAGAARCEVARHPLGGAEARRLSAFREVSLAFAQRYLGKVRTEPGMEGQVEQSFADAAAVIAFVKSGGSATSAIRFSRLREAGLTRWDGRGPPPPATHRTLDTLLSNLNFIETSSMDDVLRNAASAALSGAPKTAAALKDAWMAADDQGVLVDLEQCPAGSLRAIRRSYERDLDATLARMGGDRVAVERFSRFGLYTAPSGLEDAFDEATQRVGGAGDDELAMSDHAALEDNDEGLARSP